MKNWYSFVFFFSFFVYVERTEDGGGERQPALHDVLETCLGVGGAKVPGRHLVLEIKRFDHLVGLLLVRVHQYVVVHLTAPTHDERQTR